MTRRPTKRPVNNGGPGRWPGRDRPHGARALKSLMRLSVAGAALLAGLLGPFALAVAQAQEFVKVEDGAREQLPATPFVGAAYGFIWLALLLYVLVVARGLAGVQRDLHDLRRRLDRAEGARIDVAPSRRP